MPGDATGVAYTWGLDGNMASRTWGAYVSGAYAYDGAKRPVTLAIKFGTSSMGTIGRTYDVAGNVTSETQTLTRTGGSGFHMTLAYGHTESFTYDAANRVSGSSFDGTSPETRTYTYDYDSNRTVVYEAGVTFYYFYDNTDELEKKGPNSDGSGASTLAYDGLGNITTNQPSGPDLSSLLATTYTYDPAGHLLTIDDGTPSQKVVFTIDAAGRHLTQTIGTGAATTYAYLGTSDQITTTTQSGTTTYSAIDAIGDRLDQGSTSSIAGWLVPDLHGNIAAAVSAGAGPAYLTAYRYDPYGETIAVWNAASGSISVPWRYQGRMLESSASATDLYDFGARSYDPSLGAFTAFDSVAGSAQNPLTLNRYLYANANPATMVDPSGHSACSGADFSACEYQAPAAVSSPCNYSYCPDHRDTYGYYTTEKNYGGSRGRPSQDMTTSVYNYQHPLQNTTDMTTSVYNYQHPVQNTTDMTTSVYNSTHPQGRGGTTTTDPTNTIPDYPHWSQGTHTPGPDCEWNPFSGHSCLGQVAGGLGNEAGDLAGGLGNTARQIGGGAGDFWAHTGGDLWNSAGDLKDWAITHPQDALTLLAASAVLVMACALACPELLGGAGLISALGGADIGLAYVSACYEACAALATMAGPTLNFTVALIKAVTQDPQFDNFSAPNGGPGNPPLPPTGRR